MATMLDHKHQTLTHGTPEHLTELMITEHVRTPFAKRLPANGRARYARAHVLAAIRRNGRTDLGQELRLTDAERIAWESTYPLPE